MCQWIPKLCQESYAGRPSWEVSFLRRTCEDMRTHSLSFSAAFLAFRDHEIFGSAQFASRILSLSQRAPHQPTNNAPEQAFLTHVIWACCMPDDRALFLHARPGVGHRCIVAFARSAIASISSKRCAKVPRAVFRTHYHVHTLRIRLDLPVAYGHPMRTAFILGPHPPRGLRGAPESLLKKASRTLRVSRRRNWARSPS